MLVYVDIRVNTKDMTFDELWDAWEDETKAALGAMEAGKLAAAYKVYRAKARHRHPRRRVPRRTRPNTHGRTPDGPQPRNLRDTPHPKIRGLRRRRTESVGMIKT